MKKTSLPVIVFFLMAPSTYADLFLEQALNAVNMFNSMNNKQGYVFTQKTNLLPGGSSLGSSSIMTTKSGKDVLGLDAYDASYASGVDVNGNQFFYTFCVEPAVITSGMVRGKLEYSNGTSTTATGKDNLSLGTAALYARYTSGTLDGYADNVDMMFVTLFYAHYDIRDGRLTYVNAGHNPPYRIAPDGRLESLGATVTTMARAEGLDAHSNAVSLRLNEK